MWKRWWSKHKDSEWRGQWSVIWRRCWRGNWYSCDWRRRLDWIHKEKHWRCNGKDGTRKDSLLEQDSQKNKIEIRRKRSATSPSERWLKKAAEWNPELSSRYRTNRAIGRPKKKMGRWHQRIPQSRKWRNWKPNRKQQSNQQNLDQHSQRP